jgi:hypothetical protein
MPYQKVTFLEDLPDVNEFETNEGYNRSSHLSQPTSNVPNRFIRNNASPMYPESGMVNIPSSNMIFDNPAEQYQEPTRMQSSSSHNHQAQNAIPTKHELLEPFTQTCQPNCQEIYFHIESCPLCKKFYKQDNTIYLIVIAILLLICALMMKKILYP